LLDFPNHFWLGILASNTTDQTTRKNSLIAVTRGVHFFHKECISQKVENNFFVVQPSHSPFSS